jgi:hypothetical protein
MKGGRSVFIKKLWDFKLVGERVPIGFFFKKFLRLGGQWGWLGVEVP